VAGGPSQKENPRCIYAAPARLATRDARPRQLPTDTSHAAPTRECQSDPPSLPRDARHPTLATYSANPRRALTYCSMSDALRQMPLTQGIVRGARHALHTLSLTAHHRLPFQDALIAATAARQNVGVLHYDGHFDTLSKVLGFESRWVAAPGSL
jgi:hypothetical protein